MSRRVDCLQAKGDGVRLVKGRFCLNSCRMDGRRGLVEVREDGDGPRDKVIVCIPMVKRRRGIIWNEQDLV